MDSQDPNPVPSTTLPGPSHSGAAIDSITASTHTNATASGNSKKKKRNKKKKGARKQSFMGPSMPEDVPEESVTSQHGSPETSRYWNRGNIRRLSESSVESKVFMDHRDQPMMRPRRDSRSVFDDLSKSFRGSDVRRGRGRRSSAEDSDEEVAPDSRTPLIGGDRRDSTTARYGLFNKRKSKRSGSAGTSRSSIFRRPLLQQQNSSVLTPFPEYDVNNPPSMPPSPNLDGKAGNENNLDELMINEFAPTPVRRIPQQTGDQLIDIDGDGDDFKPSSSSPPKLSEQRRHTIPFTTAEDDVCYPLEGLSELAEEDYVSPERLGHSRERPARRKRGRQWPDLGILEEFSIDEKAELSETRRAKATNEPLLVGGRLRPHKTTNWQREVEDEPYRFTYFNDELENTLHSQTLSELPPPGQTFRNLFIPDRPILEDSSDGEEEEEDDDAPRSAILSPAPRTSSRADTRQSSILGDFPRSQQTVQYITPPGEQNPSSATTQGAESHTPTEKPVNYGPRPVFWLDVMNPSEAEMKAIQKAFGIHPLTAEDILLQEPREKVELFRNYYFVSYRTFEQDPSSVDYLEPVSFYTVVFREGVISFHFTPSPHPANVRRRIRQLKDYLQLTADWVCYGIIDDITDAFAPLIQNIEDEVDDIDDSILMMHVKDNVKFENDEDKKKDPEKQSISSGSTVVKSNHGDLLLRVGQGRKKVMGLYRLLGNKADVIKGFAKRCNEQWEVAPRSDIGLYLGDIQDHLLTMTGNLTHYETLLSRAHDNYLAQINIRMNERQESTSNSLNNLTILGTIVLPMNIITGMWGMNVLVPGQDVENLYWFFSITAGLVLFGVTCFFIAKRFYAIG